MRIPQTNQFKLIHPPLAEQLQLKRNHLPMSTPSRLLLARNPTPQPTQRTNLLPIQNHLLSPVDAETATATLLYPNTAKLKLDSPPSWTSNFKLDHCSTSTPLCRRKAATSTAVCRTWAKLLPSAIRLQVQHFRPAANSTRLILWILELDPMEM